MRTPGCNSTRKESGKYLLNYFYSHADILAVLNGMNILYYLIVISSVKLINDFFMK